MGRVYEKLPPLEVEPELKAELDAYAKRLGVPRARVIRDILRAYLGPIAARPRGLGAEQPLPPAEGSYE